jgi:release factor glutamine methyltransferase
MTVTEALAAAVTLGLDRLDAQLLLLHALQRPATERAWLLAHDTDALTEAVQQAYLTLAQRRAAGEPLAYLVGSKAFFGLDLQVDARVLVPRPDTETLVEWALAVLPPKASAGVPEAPRIVDLGTGSGAIALALKQTRPDVQVLAVDASTDALAVARANAASLGLVMDMQLSSWLQDVSDRFHLIVANPPYIAEGDSHLEALRHEPRQALTAGADGLDDIRHIIRQAPAHLLPGGWLLLEHGWDQAAAVRKLLSAAGLEAVQTRRDIGGNERCSGGRARQR